MNSLQYNDNPNNIVESFPIGFHQHPRHSADLSDWYLQSLQWQPSSIFVFFARGNFMVRQTRTCFRSFAVAGPAAWNSSSRRQVQQLRTNYQRSVSSLPVHIRNIRSHSAFCRQLKTYLFTVPDWITVSTLIMTTDFFIFMYSILLLICNVCCEALLSTGK